MADIKITDKVHTSYRAEYAAGPVFSVYKAKINMPFRTAKGRYLKQQCFNDLVAAYKEAFRPGNVILDQLEGTDGTSIYFRVVVDDSSEYATLYEIMGSAADHNGELLEINDYAIEYPMPIKDNKWA